MIGLGHLSGSNLEAYLAASIAKTLPENSIDVLQAFLSPQNEAESNSMVRVKLVGETIEMERSTNKLSIGDYR